MGENGGVEQKRSQTLTRSWQLCYRKLVAPKVPDQHSTRGILGIECIHGPPVPSLPNGGFNSVIAVSEVDCGVIVHGTPALLIEHVNEVDSVTCAPILLLCCRVKVTRLSRITRTEMRCPGDSKRF